MNKENKVFVLIGKIVVALIIIIILLPFALNKWFRNVFNPPRDEIYTMDIDTGNPFTDKTMAVTFSDDDIMHIYTLNKHSFELTGIRLDYKFSGDSYHHLFGPLYVTSNPSILPWENYKILNQYVLDKASVRILLQGINTINVSEVEEFDKKSIHTIEISINTKSITLDGNRLTIISEDDPTDYLIQMFDRESENVYSSQKE